MEPIEDDLEYILSSNRRRVLFQMDRLLKLLNAIKPAAGNFLFSDLVGRIIWNAAAVTNSINQLTEKSNDYGVGSLLRKLVECKVLVGFMLTADNRSKIIAKIWPMVSST